MGNLADVSGNFIQKDIVNKIGNQIEQNKKKGDGDLGQTNQRNVGENMYQNKYQREFLKISSNLYKQNHPPQNNYKPSPNQKIPKQPGRQNP